MPSQGARAPTSAKNQTTALDVLHSLVDIIPYLALLLVHGWLADTLRWTWYGVEAMVRDGHAGPSSAERLSTGECSSDRSDSDERPLGHGRAGC